MRSGPEALEAVAAAEARPPEERVFVIEIANSGRWVRDAAAAGVHSLGIGHDNLRERLQRHYPGAHEFSIEAQGGWVVVRVKILCRGPMTPSVRSSEATAPPITGDHRS